MIIDHMLKMIGLDLDAGETLPTDAPLEYKIFAITRDRTKLNAPITVPPKTKPHSGFVYRLRGGTLVDYEYYYKGLLNEKNLSN